MASSGRDAGAVFVDRDGVICENRPDHVRAWADFAFLPGAVEALASLSRAGERVFVVTNQAVVGRGLLSRRGLDVIHERMLAVLEGSGAHVEAVLVCPHHPGDGCGCRKPATGLLTDAATRFDVDLRRSFMIGDFLTDIEAGSAAGCESVLVRTGRGAACARAGFDGTRPDFIADDLVDAAIWVLTRRAMRVGSRTEVTRQ